MKIGTLSFIPFEIIKPPLSPEDYPIYRGSIKMPKGDIMTVAGNALELGPGIKDSLRRYLRKQFRREE